MRVLHVAQPTDGGVAVIVAGLTSHQLSEGHEPIVACPLEGPLGVWLQESGIQQRPWEAVREPSAASIGETKRLATIIRAVLPDIVHLHSAKAGLAGRLALRGRIPTIYQPHAWSFEAVEGVVQRGARVWERWATRWADIVLCVSEAEREAGRARGVSAEYRVVPNGVDLRVFRQASADEQTRLRQQLGTRDAPLAVCVGRLSHQKGQDRCLEIWPAVRRAVPQAQLVLVGDGLLRASLMASHVEGVVFVGETENVRDWLVAADLVLAPSRWEGMSLVVLEALAVGRPVVATDAAGMAEAVVGAGEIVPQDRLDLLAEAVVKRLRDRTLRAEEGAAARRKAEAHFDRRRAFQEITYLCGEVVARRRAGR